MLMRVTKLYLHLHNQLDTLSWETKELGHMGDDDLKNE